MHLCVCAHIYHVTCFFLVSFRLALFHETCFTPEFTAGFKTKENVPNKFKLQFENFVNERSSMNLWIIVGRCLLQ